MRAKRNSQTLFQKLVLACLIPSVLSLNGCAFLAGSHQTITIRTNDPRAHIFVDGEEVGVGEATPHLARDKAHRVKAEVGNRRAYAYIGRRISALGVIDIIGGLLFLVNFVGLFAPGFWELEPEEVNIKLPNEADE